VFLGRIDFCRENVTRKREKSGMVCAKGVGYEDKRRSRQQEQWAVGG
jgi:hypothetical protein